MSEMTAGIGIGLITASGLLMLLWAYRSNATQMYERLAPYVGAQSVSVRRGQGYGNKLQRLGEYCGLENNEVLGQKLQWAQLRLGCETYRALCVSATLLALILGLLVGGYFAGVQQGSWLLVLAIPMLGVVGVIFGQQTWLKWRIERIDQEVSQEFPSIVELLTLSITAGEALLPAINRVAGLSNGVISQGLRRLDADVRAGDRTEEALNNFARRYKSAVIANFVDALQSALERGSPLSEVLKDQAKDVRESGHRQLLETGGKKEIYMLVPVVFLILPVTVVFAIYPSLQSLELLK